MTTTATTEDGRYNVANLGTPFSMALVCRRCGGLVQYSTDTGDGTARAVHNDFHARFDDRTSAAN